MFFNSTTCPRFCISLVFFSPSCLCLLIARSEWKRRRAMCLNPLSSREGPQKQKHWRPSRCVEEGMLSSRRSLQRRMERMFDEPMLGIRRGALESEFRASNGGEQQILHPSEILRGRGCYCYPTSCFLPFGLMCVRQCCGVVAGTRGGSIQGALALALSLGARSSRSSKANTRALKARSVVCLSIASNISIHRN